MAKLTIGKPDNMAGMYWPTKPSEKFYISDAKVDLGIVVTPGWGVSIRFLLPDKKTLNYGQLDLTAQQAEGLVGLIKTALDQFQPDMVLRNGDSEPH